MTASPEGPEPLCPSGACEHRAAAHADIGRGLCLVRGCPCPRSPEGPDEGVRGAARIVRELFRHPCLNPPPMGVTLDVRECGTCATCSRDWTPEARAILAPVLPLLTAERERAEEYLAWARQEESIADEARERADRLAQDIATLCDRADNACVDPGLLHTRQLRAALSSTDPGRG